MVLTRKQQWRRTKTTRRQGWVDLPPDVLDQMLANGHGLPKITSWDTSMTASAKFRGAERAVEAQVQAAKMAHSKAQSSSLSSAARSLPAAAMQRSVSCQALAAKRTLFPRPNSRTDLSAVAAEVHGGTTPRRPKHVSFDGRVRMILIPRREEISEVDRYRLWWGRDDYAKFRQVLIEWRRRNADRFTPQDNILSVDLGDLDDEAEVAMAAAAAAAAAATADATAAAATSPAVEPAMAAPEPRGAQPSAAALMVAAAMTKGSLSGSATAAAAAAAAATATAATGVGSEGDFEPPSGQDGLLELVDIEEGSDEDAEPPESEDPMAAGFMDDGVGAQQPENDSDSPPSPSGGSAAADDESSVGSGSGGDSGPRLEPVDVVTVHPLALARSGGSFDHSSSVSSADGSSDEGGIGIGAPTGSPLLNCSFGLRRGPHGYTPPSHSMRTGPLNDSQAYAHAKARALGVGHDLVRPENDSAADPGAELASADPSETPVTALTEPSSPEGAPAAVAVVSGLSLRSRDSVEDFRKLASQVELLSTSA